MILTSLHCKRNLRMLRLLLPATNICITILKLIIIGQSHRTHMSERQSGNGSDGKAIGKWHPPAPCPFRLTHPPIGSCN